MNYGKDYLYAEEKKVNPASPKLVIFSDIRGDFRLLLTLLTQVTKIARYNNNDKLGEWHWNVTDTTLVCLGNFTDRYSEKGYNRLLISTKQAIEDEKKILHAFKQLEHKSKSQRQGNSVVVILGDHELGNLYFWKSYRIYQTMNPKNASDQQEREDFVNNFLRPFCLKHAGIVASWGKPGASICFSRGALTREWLQQVKPKSIQDLNHMWRKWNEENNFVKLNYLGQDNSPVMSQKLSIKPQLWRQEDEDFVTQFIGEDPNPKFVQSAVPIQILETETWDINIRQPYCEKNDDVLFVDPSIQFSNRTMLVSTAADGSEQVYFIHNCMADVYCSFTQDDRQPQALQLEMRVTNSLEALYLQCKILRMFAIEYSNYINERPFGTCPKPEVTLPLKDIKLTDHDIIQLNARLEDSVIVASNDESHNIELVGLLIFSHDMKTVLALKQPVETKTKSLTETWNIPVGTRKKSEEIWHALQHHVRTLSKLSPLETSWSGVTLDYRDYIRIFVKRMHKNSVTTIDDTKAEWVSYASLFSDRRTHVTRTLLCMIARANYIPVSTEVIQGCPAWITQEITSKPRNRQRIKGWWE